MRTLVHCSYHKCLTVYYSAVAKAVFNKFSISGEKYRHFNSQIDEFWSEYRNYQVTSVNNRFLDLAQLGDDFRITRFVRDPRDLIISGYFYHKRGAEPWCHIENPTDRDWYVVNGSVPANIPPGDSYTAFLNKLDHEDGLIAEINFRAFHFDAMRKWGQLADRRVKTFRYEDIVGNEADIFSELISFYGLSYLHVLLSRLYATRYSAAKMKRKHIRNASPQQWKRHFTKRVNDYFEARHGDLLDLYGYQ